MCIAKKKKYFLILTKSSIIIQKNIRMVVFRNKYKNILKKFVVIQKWYKKNKLDYKIRCVSKIQYFYRAQKQRIFMKNKIIQQRRWELMTESWEKQERIRLDKNRIKAEELKREHDLKIQKIQQQEKEFFERIEREKLERKREEELLKLQHIKREKEIEKRSRELEEKSKRLAADNEMFRNSIQENVNKKIKMASQMEKLMIQNRRMQIQMKRMVEMRNEEKNCIVS